MDALKEFLDLFLHLDKFLSAWIQDYGSLTYLILFTIIFVETGLVIMPFLPGDSLLFAAGIFAGKGDLNIMFLIILLIVAAFLGDTLNYMIGRYIGPRIIKRDYFFIKGATLQKHLCTTEEFYKKHGGKTIIFARFIPIIRTFAPFVAGLGTMQYSKFLLYNIVGGIAWVAGFILIGYAFGDIPAVKDNFTLVVIGIIILSILPPCIEYCRHKFFKKTA